jgi:3-hydroxyacyl-CoA dehydrogenase/enoyl-CoA hydratase/3-hydroxybutyryl-CoA epimerase
VTHADAPASDIRWDRDDDGVVVLTMDAQGKSANTMTDTFLAALQATVGRLQDEREDISGVVVTSAKKSFFAGGDLHGLLHVTPAHAQEQHERTTAIKELLRSLEQLGRPVVAAVNGAALGGGLEIALACHHRVVLDARQVRLGLPEVTLGLLAGGGGTVRTVRLLGVEPALDELLLSGRALRPGQARDLGLVDQLVAQESDLLPAAKAWIAANPGAIQPWDAPGYRIPGSVESPVSQIAAVRQARLTKELKGAPYEAPHAILATVVEGARLGFDQALDNETRHFVTLLTGQQAKNMIQGGFLDTQAVASGVSRPDGHERATFDRIGVVGAGMMGAGLAYVAAKNGMSVVLKDVSVEAAERGKDYSRRLVDKGAAAGRMSAEDGAALLDRILVTTDFSEFAGCQAVIEAVFEDPALKQEQFRQVAEHAPDALMASNTSTLPISELAEGTADPETFIGMHFFSPVDRMPLVEIVRGAKTSDATVARAFDLGRALGLTAIVVNDGRGFFTSRVITQYIDEAIAMVGEGVPIATIDRAGTQAGYPAGPLQLIDETSLTLPRKVRQEARRAADTAGVAWAEHPAERVMNQVIDEFGREGRRAGAGFYEYVDGKRTRPWPGFAEHYGTDLDIPIEDVKERLLFSEALETVRTFEDGVLTSAADANVGSMLGIGFPRWTGGVVQFMNGYPGGLPAFVARARELAERYGRRFAPPQSLVEKAAGGADARYQ